MTKLKFPNYEHLPVLFRQQMARWGYEKDPDNVRRFFKEIYGISEDYPNAQCVLDDTIESQKGKLLGGLEVLT